MKRVPGAALRFAAALLAIPSLVFMVAAAAAEPLMLEVASAKSTYSRELGAAVLTITFSENSKQAFATFTAAHIGERVELRAGGKVLLSAIVREAIVGGVVQVSGQTIGSGAAGTAKLLSAPGARIEVEAHAP